MFKTAFAVTGLLLAVATPAFAEGKPESVAMGAGTPAAAVPAKPSVAATRRYCILQDVTGSILPQKTCLTREAWLERGFDPLKK